MQLLKCPFCGNRDQSEFTYVREVAPVPSLQADQSAWQTYVYERDNPRGPHNEWWHHHLGCRQILEIVRDTMTHEIISVQTARKGAIPS